MRTSIMLLIGAVIAVAGPATAAPRHDGEAKLAKALKGRVAGAPVDCVNLRQIRSTRIIDGTGILYDAGSTIYLNRPRSGARSLDRWDTMVTKLHSSQLCRIDVVHLYESGSRMQTGFVFLGDFIPYRRPK